MSIINHDHERGSRTGIPEVVLAEPKINSDLIIAISEAMKKNKKVLVTRIQEHQLSAIHNLINKSDWEFEFDDFKRTLMIYQEKWHINELSVAIMSAGTSDRFIVDEITLSLKFFGWSADVSMDIGVAGIHRFKEALNRIKSKTGCIIVVAGQDGALFPVITGQTTLPVIAVPSSIGYGFGGKGETALRSALQSCAPGIATVNIDNGFGAAALAAKILKTILYFIK